MFIASSTLSACVVSGDDQPEVLAPFIGYPTKPFQLRPGRVTPLLYLHTRKPGGWFAVHASVLDSIRLSNLIRAHLYEGVCDDGQPFLFPAPQAIHPDSVSWEASTSRVIQLAQSGQWVSQTSNKSRGERTGYVERSIRKVPQWFAGSLEDLLDKAFKGRIIDHPQHTILTGQHRVPCYEEIEESYP